MVATRSHRESQRVSDSHFKLKAASNSLFQLKIGGKIIIITGLTFERYCLKNTEIPTICAWFFVEICQIVLFESNCFQNIGFLERTNSSELSFTFFFDLPRATLLFRSVLLFLLFHMSYRRIVFKIQCYSSIKISAS